MMNVTRMCVVGCFLGSLATSAFAEGGEDGATPNSAPVGQYAVTPGIQHPAGTASARVLNGEDGPLPSSAPVGQYAVRRGLQGPAGTAWARVLIDADMSADNVGKPTSLTPDLFYSVTDQLQLGLLHQGPMGWQARPGLGVCLTGKDNGCRKIYDNVGLDVLYGLPMMGQLDLSAHGSLFVNHFDPMANLALGVTGKAYLGNNLALVFDPKISIALSDRDTNEDALFMPVELEVQMGAPMTFKVLTGISGSLSTFGDTHEIPAGIGLVHNLNKHLDVGARFSFDNLLGKQPEDAGRADTRSAVILLNIRA